MDHLKVAQKLAEKGADPFLAYLVAVAIRQARVAKGGETERQVDPLQYADRA